MANIMERLTADNKIAYTARIRVKGFPQQTATFARKTDARLWAQKTEASIRVGKYFSQAESKRHTFSDLAARYIKTALGNKSPKVRIQYQQQLKKWCEMIGDRSLAEINPAVISECREKLSEEKTHLGKIRSSASINRYMAVLSSIFSVAVREWQWVEENPVKKIKKLKESEGRNRFLSEDEIDRLIKACRGSRNKNLLLVVVLSLSTGARQMEIWGLKWREVDLNEGTATLIETKNSQIRVVPIQSYALELMREKSRFRRIETNLVFPSTVDPQKPFDFRKAWKAALRKALIDDFRWHDLRHSAASYLAMNGASIREIAEILGHKTLQMSMRYAHLTENHSKSLVKAMNEKMFRKY